MRSAIGRSGAVGELWGTVDTRYAGLCMSRHARPLIWRCDRTCLRLVCRVVYVVACAPGDLRGWFGWLSCDLSGIACAGMCEQ